VHRNRLESAGNRGLVPASVILIVAPGYRTENASVDSCHVARMAILESTDSDSSRRLACVSVYVYSP